MNYRLCPSSCTENHTIFGGWLNCLHSHVKWKGEPTLISPLVKAILYGFKVALSKVPTRGGSNLSLSTWGRRQIQPLKGCGFFFCLRYCAVPKFNHYYDHIPSSESFKAEQVYMLPLFHILAEISSRVKCIYSALLVWTKTVWYWKAAVDSFTKQCDRRTKMTVCMHLALIFRMIKCYLDSCNFKAKNSLSKTAINLPWRESCFNTDSRSNIVRSQFCEPAGHNTFSLKSVVTLTSLFHVF